MAATNTAAIDSKKEDEKRSEVNSTRLDSQTKQSTIQKPIKNPYFHKGQILDGPPFSVRLLQWISTIWCFTGLWACTFFSLDPMVAAQSSPFASSNRKPTSFPLPNTIRYILSLLGTVIYGFTGRAGPVGSNRLGGAGHRPLGGDKKNDDHGDGGGNDRKGGGGGGGGSWGSGSDYKGGGAGGMPKKRIGTVDDVRGPECGSCPR